MIHTPPQGTIDLGTRVVPYRIVPSMRARSLRLRIGPRPEVTIVVPPGQAVRDVAGILLPSSAWILRQVEKIEQGMPAPLGSGACLPYLGNEYPLVLESGTSRSRIALRDGRLIVAGPVAAPQSLPSALECWYREQARAILSERVGVFEPVMGARHARIAIRDQKTRWGSCSSQGNLSFNWRLVMAPLPVIDYVVVHELAHLSELSHSQRFWDIVARYCPDHREHRRWLREHGPRLALLLTSPAG
jgi:predicted metal-dependent hydrolase